MSFGNRPFAIFAVCFAPLLVSGQSSSVPPRPQGYLHPAQLESVERIVLPAPSTGDPRYVADMAIFHETRAQEGSARWALAQSDDNLSITGQLLAFRCALGLSLTPENAPKLVAFLSRAEADAGAATGVLKQRYRHKRPFQVAEGDVCLSPAGKAALEQSPDYPSSHATLSWETGLILAQLFPESAASILARARAFGQSRVVCGVHNASAVEAGWMTASAVLAMQDSSPYFRTDLEAARSEVAAMHASGNVKLSACAAETATLDKSPY